MSMNLNDIEEKFRSSFNNWDADFNTDEMQLDWQTISTKISSNKSGKSQGSKFGKLLTFTGAGLAILVVSSYLLTRNNADSISENNPLNTSSELTSKLSNPLEKNLSLKNEKALEEAKSEDIENKKYSSTISTPESNRSTLLTDPNLEIKTNKIETELVKPGNILTENKNNKEKPKVNEGQTTNQSELKIKSMFVFSDSVICKGGEVTLVKTAQNQEINNVTWGDGSNSSISNQETHSYTNSGNYLLTIKIKDKHITKTIRVLEPPKAFFSSEQSGGLSYKFKNISANAFSYSWDFGDGSNDRVQNPLHNFKDSGIYKITLSAINPAGCSDTFSQIIQVSPNINPNIPFNSFSPNGDGKNEEFVINISGESYFRLAIFDQSGKQVFESSDKNKPWTGTNSYSNTPCPTGQYMYYLEYRMAGTSKSGTRQGVINLFR